MTDKNIHQGDQVSWTDASHQSHGIVSEISTAEPVSIQTKKGNEVKQNATEENPGVKQENLGKGGDVVKKMGELEKESGGEAEGEKEDEMKHKSEGEGNEKDEKGATDNGEVKDVDETTQNVDELNGTVGGGVIEGQVTEVEEVEEVEMRGSERDEMVGDSEASRTKEGRRVEVGDKRGRSEMEGNGGGRDDGMSSRDKEDGEPGVKKQKHDVEDKGVRNGGDEGRQGEDGNGNGVKGVEDMNGEEQRENDLKGGTKTKQTPAKKAPGRPRKAAVVAAKKVNAPVEPGKTRVKVKARENN